MTSLPDGESELPEFDPALLVELDLREFLRQGGAPRERILTAIDALPEHGVLHLRTPFRPVPLIQLLTDRGFHCHSASFSEGDWSTWFWRTIPALPVATHPAPGRLDTRDAEDLRLMPPPEPLLRILERIDNESAPFDVLLPFYPELLVAVLREGTWTMELISEMSEGVRVRLSPGAR